MIKYAITLDKNRITFEVSVHDLRRVKSLALLNTLKLVNDGDSSSGSPVVLTPKQIESIGEFYKIEERPFLPIPDPYGNGKVFYSGILDRSTSKSRIRLVRFLSYHAYEIELVKTCSLCSGQAYSLVSQVSGESFYIRPAMLYVSLLCRYHLGIKRLQNKLSPDK